MDDIQSRHRLHALLRAWQQINKDYLGEGLQPPVIEFTEQVRVLGLWTKQTRTIAISRAACVTQPWPFVIDILKHEMAHQYVDEILQPEEETAHGPAFKRVCRQLGISTRASLSADLPSKPNPIIERIHRLLKLGESSNEHEAQAALNKAKQLLERHKIDHLEWSEQPEYLVKYLGAPKSRVSAAEKVLAGMLARDFFIAAIWVPANTPSSTKNTKVLEISGQPHHVELAEHVYTFLLNTIESLWSHVKQTHGYRGKAQKRGFSLGLLQGFSEKTTLPPTETELVKHHDKHLQGFVQTRHPKLRSTRNTTVLCDDTYLHGKTKGSSITIHSPIKENSRRTRNSVVRKLPLYSS